VISVAETMMASSLVLVGNGPGEVAGWAVPIAAEARRQAAARQRALDVTLCLPPCQFASGQEKRVAAAAAVFSRILDPAATFRLSLGLPGWSPPAPAVLLHVGGSFWYSHRLARRWRARAFAFVERAHIARIHHPFERIFLPTPDLAERLLRYGVPAAKLLVTGDPRHDALPDRALVSHNGNGAPPQVTLLCGSRNPVFSAFFPFWVRTATALRQRLPAVRLRLVVSPYVAPHVQQGVIRQHRRALDAAGIEVAHGGWSHILDSDLVLTLPGTNTLELAVLRIPSIVVLPVDLAPSFTAEGAGEWITRLLPFGQFLRRWMAPSYVRRLTHVALPNLIAGRRIMPELVGDITPGRVAEESVRLLQDDGARRKVVEDLMTIRDEVGASRAVIGAMPLWSAA
jgi:lipid-A-disaccharide synthase